MARRSLRRLLLVALSLSLGACSGLGYYAQLARGQYQVLARREPIARMLADPATAEPLRSRLAQALEARKFASDHLDLPRNASYTLYADLGRPYAVYNVFAAPELSLDPVVHCFPIAGCVAYRGYYSLEGANAEAAVWRAKGDETYVGPVTAYSTLGWFDDPILNTMLRWDDDELHATIFHELTHQKLYLKGDTEFNESLASFVEREGLRQWRIARGLPSREDISQQRDDQFTQAVLELRARLQTLYTSAATADGKRAGKLAAIAEFRVGYRSLRDTQWAGYSGYDAWVNGEINNAKLLPFGLYHRWVPAFAALYAQSADWPGFFSAAQALSKQPKAEREQRLTALQGGLAAVSALAPGLR